MAIDFLVTLKLKYSSYSACLYPQRLIRNLTILTKKKEMKLKQKNRKKAILLNIAGCILNPGHGKIPAPDFNFYIQKDKYPI